MNAYPVLEDTRIPYSSCLFCNFHICLKAWSRPLWAPSPSKSLLSTRTASRSSGRGRGSPDVSIVFYFFFKVNCSAVSSKCHSLDDKTMEFLFIRLTMGYLPGSKNDVLCLFVCYTDTVEVVGIKFRLKYILIEMKCRLSSMAGILERLL